MPRMPRIPADLPLRCKNDTGVVSNFGPLMGTSAGRRVQDMSELEILGKAAD